MSTAREGSVLSSHGVWLYFHAWTARRPRHVLAVLPGLGEHGGRYATLGTWLAEWGTSVWAVDLRGMGQSGGRRGQLESWSDWLDDARRLWTLVEREAPGLEIVPLGPDRNGRHFGRGDRDLPALRLRYQTGDRLLQDFRKRDRRGSVERRKGFRAREHQQLAGQGRHPQDAELHFIKRSA